MLCREVAAFSRIVIDVKQQHGSRVDRFQRFPAAAPRCLRDLALVGLPVQKPVLLLLFSGQRRVQ